MLNRGLDKLELLRIVEAVANEKSIDKELVIGSMESAIQKAALIKFGSDNNIEVIINRENGEIKRVVTSHSLGGGRNLGKKKVEDTIATLKEFLISTFGKGWELEGEYGLDGSEESAIEKRIPNVGYTKEVREFSVTKNLTSWAEIEMFDKIIGKHGDGEVPGFADRYFRFYDSGNPIPFELREREKRRRHEEEEGEETTKRQKGEPVSASAAQATSASVAQATSASVAQATSASVAAETTD